MKNRMFKRGVLCLSLLCAGQVIQAQDSLPADSVRFLFRFVEGDDMLYVPYKGNGGRLDSLCLVLVPQVTEEGTVRVDGYSATRSLSMIRCNRVKSELIMRGGMQERHFTTTNNAGTYNGLRNVVIVTLPVASEKPVCPETAEAEDEVAPEKASEPLPEFPFIVEEPQPEEPDVEELLSELPAQTLDCCVKTVPSRWSVGFNVGVPFFWGDMVTMAYDKTYVGIATGLQGSYRFSQLLGLTLSADYACGKAGARDYSKGYTILPDGMTSYGPQQSAVPYGDLYARISAVNLGLSLDMNVNRIFCRDAIRHRFTVWVSPTVFGQFFDSHLFSKADGSRFSDGSLRPAAVSLGLGGSLTLRYRIGSCLELQLKNSLVWITDNNFDAVATPYGTARQNAMWTPRLGIVWNIK